MTRQEFQDAGGCAAMLKVRLLDGRIGTIGGLTSAGVLRVMTVRGEIPEEVNVMLWDVARASEGILAQCRPPGLKP